MSARSIEAGRAHVRVDAELSPLQKRLGQIDAKFKALGSRISGIGKNFAAVGAGATAIGSAALGGITALSTRFASLGDELSKTRDRTGISASSLSELGYAATQSGTDLGTVERSIAKMQRGIVDANAGSKSMAEAFDAIGVSATELAKLSPEDQFLQIGKAIADIPDATTRAGRAMQIFGRSGTQLLPLLISDVEALRKEARDLGVVISDEDATNATNLGDAFDRVKKSLGGIATQLGAAIAVPFTNIANALAGIIGKLSAWVAANRSIVQTVAAVAAGFVVVGTVVTGVGIALVGLGATIASVGAISAAAVGAIGVAFNVLASPITLVAAGIAAIGYVALEATGGLAKLGEMFGSLGSTATTAWTGIVAAISSGDLETAGQIAFTGLEVAWLTVTTKMQEVWTGVASFFKDVWLNAVESIVQVGANIYFGIAKYFDQLAVTLQGAFDTAAVYITGAIDGVQTQIAKAIIQAQEFFGLFSKEESQQIQGSLDSELARRAGGRQSGLDQRAAGRQSGLDARDQSRRATAEQFAQIVGEDIDRRRSSGSVDRSGLSGAQQRLAELQASLQSKSSGAVKAAEAQQLSEKAKQADQAQQGAAAALSSTSAGSVGTFVSGVAGRIAGGGVQDEIKNATVETATNTAKLTDQMRQMLEEGALT